MAKTSTKKGRSTRNDGEKAKAWNITPSSKLRAFVAEFVRLNDRPSATAVVEEALREYFEKRGIKTDVEPAELLRAILERENDREV
jgi:hypothetical protein